MKRTRKSLLNDIKILLNNKKTLRQFAKEEFINENNEAVINVFLNENNLYNQFSDPLNRDISKDVYEYIESKAHFIPVEYPIVINVHSSIDLDKEMIQKKISDHYLTELIDKDDDLKNNSIISIFLFVLGAILLSLYFVFTCIPTLPNLFNEIFSVAGSFSVWEAVDYSLLNRGALKIERLNLAQLALSKINIIK